MKFGAEYERVPLDVRGLIARRYKVAGGVTSELVTWNGSDGPFIVIYSGLPGAYETNRPHFLDFLRLLTTR